MKRFLQNPNCFLVVLLALWTVLNIFQGIYTELANDEAYYWVLSKDISWGYYDHPPMIGWLVGLSTAIVGNTQLGVRLFCLLLQPISLYLFWTLVRTPGSTRSTALCYFLVAFSIPLLQLYGFIASPDAPLLFCTAFLLWGYKRFLDCPEDDFSTMRAVTTTVVLAIAAAMICYAKYHGVLVIGLIVLSNFSLFRSPRFYAAAALAVMFFLPHIVWQYSHDWVSFEYHLSGRTSAFEWENVWLYVVNFIATFNPLLLPLFFVMMFRRANQGGSVGPDLFVTALKYLTWGFLAFFLWSTRNLHVQPQWLIPVVFPMLYFVVRGARRRPAMRRYVLRVGGVMVLLFVVFRVFVMSYTGDKINADIFNNDRYTAFADSLGGRPLITNGNYVSASKMRFYGHNAAWARPDIMSRSSHYQFMDMDSHLYMKQVAVEISDSAHLAYNREQKDSLFGYVKIWEYNIYYDTISDYIPSRYVTVKVDLPDKMLAGREVMFEVEVANPYPFNIPLGSGRNHFELTLQLRRDRFHSVQIPMPLRSTYVPANGAVRENVHLLVPRIDTAPYTAGFALVRFPYGAWFNSERKEVQIINTNR